MEPATHVDRRRRRRSSAIRPQNPFETARLALVRKILEMRAPPAMPTFPSPHNHLAVADHLRQAAAIFDEWLLAVGHEVRDNATIAIDADTFEGVFASAIDGNALYACEQASEALIDSRRHIGRGM
jgi:hypothetical protein